ncbi:MAG: TIGR00269 family protein [Nitrosopumilus sp. B06]|nr:MAG: TIGR00269 family protein [Nitrosopumilus sp. B06]
MTKCDMCEKEAAYTRKYSGQGLCSECFSNSIARKTAKTISKHNMIRSGDLVAVAVSGGKDSLALLKIMHEMSASHNFGIVAVTIDEGIPGYRDEALGIVREFCDNLGVKCMVYSYADLFDMTLDEALVLRGEEKMSSCSICGTLRRRALDVAAKDVGADVVATGHNLDDTIQTFLINMLSGDTERIGWMDPGAQTSHPSRIKPFCEIYEAEIVFYAFTNDIPFQSEPCPHMNEGIRTEIREFFNSLEDRHSGAKNSLYQSVLKMSRIARNSGQKVGTVCGRCGSKCTGEVCSVCSTVLRLKGQT